MSAVEQRIAELEEQVESQSRRIAELEALERKAIQPRTYYQGWRLNEPRFKAFRRREDGELEDVPRVHVERRSRVLDTDVSAEPLEQVVAASPTGMEWGYGGSGPTDLALTLIAEVVPADDPEQGRLAGQYKDEVVRNLPRKVNPFSSRPWYLTPWGLKHPRQQYVLEWEISWQEIAEWVEAKRDGVDRSAKI